MAQSLASRRRARAIQINARKRRDSLRALPKIHRTRFLDTNLTPVDVAGAFPPGAASRPVTFYLDYQVTAASPSGMVLNLGNANPATTLYYDAGYLTVVAGSGSSPASAAQGVATRAHAGSVSAPLLVRLVVSVRPGDGVVRVWDRSGLILVAAASAGSIAAWSGEGVGDDITTFAAATGPNALISDPGAPVGVSPVNPAYGYALHVPQHFLSAEAAAAGAFDEFLFRATFINNQLALFPLLDDSE